MCCPCSHALLGLVTTACVSWSRDKAVSIGSHMQQDVVISQAPPHLGAPFLFLIAFSSEKHDTKRLAIVSPETWLSFVSVTTRVFSPAGRILHSGAMKNK